ncbi:hypothetical protein [Fictibacillus barbaricus]|uniref:Uncharacterized protein n=1 Tax=Fictibacillus barbaricus TaxID=182136 RepID=A0ABU1TZJ0_9BACL|nr:hypothetical protein [Fictibacillus barbaricus]MDR7072575.1 hypothetical protein [Fictibacillus barbaricus]
MENDQAEQLRNKAGNHTVLQTGSLPSRRELHQRKKGRKKEELEEQKNKKKKSFKPSFLLTKVLLVAFIALVGLMVTYQYWSDKIISPVHSNIKKGTEQVRIEQ